MFLYGRLAIQLVEIFVLPNEGVSLGNAIIEKASGKVEVGIDVSLKAIEEALSS